PCVVNGDTGVLQIDYTLNGDSTSANGTLVCELGPIDPHNCHGVDVTQLPHATGTCNAQRDPQIVSCDPDYFDADLVATTGCEATTPRLTATPIAAIDTGMIAPGSGVSLATVWVTALDTDGRSFWISDFMSGIPQTGIYVFRDSTRGLLPAGVVVGQKISI